MKEDNQKQCITYAMEAKILSELAMYFIETFDKLAFSSEVSVEIPNIKTPYLDTFHAVTIKHFYSI